MMKYGLSPHTIEAIKNVLKKHPQIDDAVLYGSRAKGTHRPNSDIDLTLKGDDIDLTILLKIESELDELLLPYQIDLNLFGSIKNVDLIDHINRVGVVFYKKSLDGHAEKNDS